MMPPQTQPITNHGQGNLNPSLPHFLPNNIGLIRANPGCCFLMHTVHWCPAQFLQSFSLLFHSGLFLLLCIRVPQCLLYLPSDPRYFSAQMFNLGLFYIFYVSPYHAHAFLYLLKKQRWLTASIKSKTFISITQGIQNKATLSGLQYGNRCMQSLCFLPGLMSIPVCLYLHMGSIHACW